MKFLNVGPLELIFILILALLLLGPERMISSARALGKWVYQLIRSPFWTSVMDTSREIRDLPTKIVREAGLEESLKEIKELNREIGKEAVLGEFDKAARDIDNQIRQAANLANQELLRKDLWILTTDNARIEHQEINSLEAKKNLEEIKPEGE